MGEKGRDLRGAHVAGVAFVVEKDVTFDPLDISLFSVNRVMFSSQGVTHTLAKLSAGLVQQFFGRLLVFISLGRLRVNCYWCILVSVCMAAY